MPIEETETETQIPEGAFIDVETGIWLGNPDSTPGIAGVSRKTRDKSDENKIFAIITHVATEENLEKFDALDGTGAGAFIRRWMEFRQEQAKKD